MLEISLKPEGCLCPNEGYTCHVNLGTEIAWITTATVHETLVHSLTSTSGDFRDVGGFRANFTGEQATDAYDNFTSTLFVVNVLDVNGTNLTCRGTALRTAIYESV